MQLKNVNKDTKNTNRCRKMAHQHAQEGMHNMEKLTDLVMQRLKMSGLELKIN